MLRGRNGTPLGTTVDIEGHQISQHFADDQSRPTLSITLARLVGKSIENTMRMTSLSG